MSTKKTFNKVYVLSDGSRMAHIASNECNIDPRNFVYLNSLELIKHLEGCLFLLTDSFSKNKYLFIEEINKLKNKHILTIEEFKLNVYYKENKCYKSLKTLTI